MANAIITAMQYHRNWRAEIQKPWKLIEAVRQRKKQKQDDIREMAHCHRVDMGCHYYLAGRRAELEGEGKI